MQDNTDIFICRILEDIAIHLKSYLDDKNINYSYNSASDIILAYLKIKDKYFPAKPRQVVYSNHLKNKIDKADFTDGNGQKIRSNEFQNLKELIQDFEKKFRDGIDVTNHLNKGIFSDKTDYILSHWSLRHLHLSNDEVDVDKNEMNNNRSPWLLFFLVNDTEVYFVDVCYHPHGSGFTTYQFLKIFDEEELMEQIGFRLDTTISELKHYADTDEDLYDAYKNNVNYIIKVNSKFYVPLINTTTLSGDNFSNVFKLNELKRYLDKYIKKYQYVGIRGEIEKGTSEALFRDGKKNISVSLVSILDGFST